MVIVPTFQWFLAFVYKFFQLLVTRFQFLGYQMKACDVPYLFWLKLQFPGQQIQPLGGCKHKSSLFVYKSPNCWSCNRCTKKIFSGKVYLHPRINSRPKNPDQPRVVTTKPGKTEKWPKCIAPPSGQVCKNFFNKSWTYFHNLSTPKRKKICILYQSQDMSPRNMP